MEIKFVEKPPRKVNCCTNILRLEKYIVEQSKVIHDAQGRD